MSALEEYNEARKPIDIVQSSIPSNTAGLPTADLGFTIYVEGALADAMRDELLDEVERLSTQRCATCSSLGSENDDTFVCRNVMAPAPMTDAELEDPGETWCCRWYRREG